MPYPAKDTKTQRIQVTPKQWATLRKAAKCLGYTYNGEGSPSLLIQALADFFSATLDNES